MLNTKDAVKTFHRNPELQKQDEGNYIKGCMEGDRNSQLVLFKSLTPTLRGVVRRYTWNEEDVQDVLQEVFLRIFKNITFFDPNKSSLVTWACRIAINTAINEGHKRSRTVNGSTNIDISIQPNALESLALDDLISVLKTMPESLYTILNLYIVDGFDHNEISGMLGISAELSRQRLSRAKRWVKERFEMEGNDWKSKRKAR